MHKFGKRTECDIISIYDYLYLLSIIILNINFTKIRIRQKLHDSTNNMIRLRLETSEANEKPSRSVQEGNNNCILYDRMRDRMFMQFI